MKRDENKRLGSLCFIPGDWELEETECERIRISGNKRKGNQIKALLNSHFPWQFFFTSMFWKSLKYVFKFNFLPRIALVEAVFFPLQEHSSSWITKQLSSNSTYFIYLSWFMKDVLLFTFLAVFAPPFSHWFSKEKLYASHFITFLPFGIKP